MTPLLLALLAACTESSDVADAAADGPPVRFGFPLPERERFPQRIGFDHDPVVQPDTVSGRVVCLDYQGRAFPHCYDEHHGTDLILEGGFDAMDAGSSPVVAGADGVVVDTADGNYDRCHADVQTGDVSCDGNPGNPNYVILEHPGGVRSMYWHLKSGSVTVAVGDEVACGEQLGLVGSSGYSSMPHLHFQVEVPAADDLAPLDPYAGPESQEDSWWEEQAEGDVLPGAGCAG